MWRTRFGVLGIGICWDQWFPESARCMALMGAEALLYPTAIGSDPPTSDARSLGAWQRVQQGHAAANFMPLVASNRIGTERGEGASMRFYGSSFIADHTGAVMAQASEDAEEVVTATVDLDEVRAYRERWSVFRDRRPDVYGALLYVGRGDDLELDALAATAQLVSPAKSRAVLAGTGPWLSASRCSSRYARKGCGSSSATPTTARAWGR